MDNIEISNDQRVLIVGKTGTGKTTLAAQFLLSIDRLIIIDSKFNMRPEEWRAEVIYSIPRELPETFRYIVRLDDPTLAGELLLKFEDYYLYVDELFAVFTSAGSASPGWRGLWTRGRERHIAVWAGVQRPAAVPLVTMSEADHFFVFRLAMEEDTDRMSKIIGVKVPRLKGHEFLYAYPARDVYLKYGRLVIPKAASDDLTPA